MANLEDINVVGLDCGVNAKNKSLYFKENFKKSSKGNDFLDIQLQGQFPMKNRSQDIGHDR